MAGRMGYVFLERKMWHTIDYLIAIHSPAYYLQEDTMSRRYLIPSGLNQDAGIFNQLRRDVGRLLDNAWQATGSRSLLEQGDFPLINVGVNPQLCWEDS
jgi:hypothetical protein